MCAAIARPVPEIPSHPVAASAVPTLASSPSGARRPAWLIALLVLGLYAALSVALFPRVATHLSTTVPRDLGDPPSQIWILAWDVHALTTNPAHLYEGNTFYPLHQVLANQDTLLSLMPVAVPVILLTGNALLAYNLIFLLSFALCAWAAYLLADLLVSDRRAALLAGLVYGFSAYRMVHLSHLNLLSAMWIPLALLCWERVRRGEARYWVGVGLFFILQVFCALYYAAFLAVGMALLLVLQLHRTARETRRDGEEVGRPAPRASTLVVGAVLTVAGCAVVLLPFLMPYFQLEKITGAGAGFGQSIHFSADLRDFLHSVDGSVLYGWTGHVLGVRSGDSLQYLWPGLITLGLVICGLRTRRTRRARRLPGPQRDYVVLCLASAMFCLGPFLKVWGHQTGLPLPYFLLYPLPGFAGWRDPARFGAIYTLCLAVLAAYGVAALLHGTTWPRRRGRAGLVAAVLCAGVLAESWIWPVAAIPLATGAAAPPVYRWLAARPVGEPVLELPIGLGDEKIWTEQTEMMYYATYHWHPIVNGEGRFVPPGYATDIVLYNRFPAADSLRLLRARGVRLVVVHRAWVGSRPADAIRARAVRTPGIRLLRHWPDADAYLVR